MDPNKEPQEAVDPLDLTQPDPQPESQPQAEKSPDEVAIEAMDKGIDEASVDESVDTAKSEEPAPEAKAEDAEERKPDEAPDVEDEIKGLQLKEKAANRFRELTGRVEELSTALKAAGVEDIKALPDLVERAKYGEELVGRVLETGANAEQFTQALGYLQLVNAAGSGDVKAAEAAFEIMQGELQALGKFLGREVAGVVDPLADHADLLEEVESGDLPRARALEIARTRNQGKIVEANQSRVQEREGQTRQQQEAMQQGVADIVSWDTDMRASDPTYMAKRAILDPIVAEIRATKPPSDWVRLTTLAYARIPTPQAAPAATKPLPGPVRGNRGTSGMIPDISKLTPEQALDLALDAH